LRSRVSVFLQNSVNEENLIEGGGGGRDDTLKTPVDIDRQLTGAWKIRRGTGGGGFRERGEDMERPRPERGGQAVLENPALLGQE